MTHDEHRERHKELHRAFDELLADYLRHNPGTYPSAIVAMELMHWSFQQTKDPTELPK